MTDPGTRVETDDAGEYVEIYEGEDTYITYNEDGEQDCFVSDEESWGA